MKLDLFEICFLNFNIILLYIYILLYVCLFICYSKKYIFLIYIFIFNLYNLVWLLEFDGFL